MLYSKTLIDICPRSPDTMVNIGIVILHLVFNVSYDKEDVNTIPSVVIISPFISFSSKEWAISIRSSLALYILIINRTEDPNLI